MALTHMHTDFLLNHIRNELLDIRFLKVNERLTQETTDTWGAPNCPPRQFEFDGGALNGEIIVDSDALQLNLHWRAPWDASIQGSAIFKFEANDTHSASDAVFKLKRRLLELSLY